MKLARRPMPQPHIPFISLADIAWQIIIFFLLATTFQANTSLNVNLPGASTDQSKSVAPTITVVVAEGALSLNNQPVSFEDFPKRISAVLAGKKTEAERAVIVLAKPDVTFQRHIDVVYAVQHAGGILVMSEEQ